MARAGACHLFLVFLVNVHSTHNKEKQKTLKEEQKETKKGGACPQYPPLHGNKKAELGRGAMSVAQPLPRQSRLLCVPTNSSNGGVRGWSEEKRKGRKNVTTI